MAGLVPLPSWPGSSRPSRLGTHGALQQNARATRRHCPGHIGMPDACMRANCCAVGDHPRWAGSVTLQHRVTRTRPLATRARKVARQRRRSSADGWAMRLAAKARSQAACSSVSETAAARVCASAADGPSALNAASGRITFHMVRRIVGARARARAGQQCFPAFRSERSAKTKCAPRGAAAVVGSRPPVAGVRLAVHTPLLALIVARAAPTETYGVMRRRGQPAATRVFATQFHPLN
jgi:hypothetical protein